VGRAERSSGRVLTQGEVEAEIVRISDEMEDALSDLADKAVAAATTQVAWKVEKAKRNLLAGTQPGNGREGKTTVDEREAMVTRDTEDVWIAALIAEAYYKVEKERLETLRSQMDAMRTIAANIRAQT
jgi:DNA-binding protein YbaB